MKAIEVCDGSTEKQTRISADTRSWEQANKTADTWLDQFDPTKIEQARQEMPAVTVANAVFRFLSHRIAHNIEADAIRGLKTILGDVAPNGDVIKDGRLFPWLAAQKPPIKYVSDMTSTQLMAWRQSWTVGDSTANNDWGKIRDFFNF